MRRTLSVLLVGWLAAIAPAVAAPAAGTEPPRPLLWKVADGDNAIYLLGSFHLLKPADYPVSADVDAAFDDAERLVFEIGPRELAEPDVQQRFLAAAGYDPPGGSLRQALPAPLHARLERWLAARGGSARPLDRFEPWFVNLTLTLQAAQKQGFRPELGLDRRLMQRAEAAGKPVGGLETLDDQLRALDSAPMDEQVAALAEFLDRAGEMPQLLDELHRAWREADLRELDALTRQEMRADTPRTYRIVNVDRNRAWLPQLRVLLDGSAADDALVVVGALHLLGDDGLVAMLRGHGYTIERICSACEPRE